jgi:hypothetical protein
VREKEIKMYTVDECKDAIASHESEIRFLEQQPPSIVSDLLQAEKDELRRWESYLGEAEERERNQR